MMESYMAYVEYKAAMLLLQVFPPGLIILGTLGNIMSIAVLTRKSMRQSTISLYLTVLAVTDITILYTGLLRQWLLYILDMDIRDLHPILCKLHVWIVYSTLDFSSWLLVAVTMERFVSIWFPHSVKKRCTKSIAGIIMVVIATVLLGINSHYLYGYGISKDANSTIITLCGSVSTEYDNFVMKVWPWMDLCVFCLIPFILLISGNVAIIIKVCISNRKRRRNDANVGLSNTESTKVRSSKTSSMTAMLLTTNVVFLVCTSPLSIYLIGEEYWWYASDIKPHKKAVANLLWALGTIIMYTNNTINFLLYCSSGSRFREALKGLLYRKRRIHPTASFTRNPNSVLNASGSQVPPETQMTGVKKQMNLSVVGLNATTNVSEVGSTSN